MLSFGAVLDKFGPHKRAGKEYRVRCPVHGDEAPSLDISQGDNGAPVFRCRSADCAAADILAAVGLTWADVLPSRGNGHHAEIVWDHIHDYQDARGDLQYQVLRKGTGHGKKIRQRRPDGQGGWIPDTKGVTPIPYRLPELIDEPRVFIAEGELKADCLWGLGCPGTCNSGGAKNWHASDTDALTAAGVHEAIILPDNDDPGRAHAMKVRAALEAVGIATRVVALPGLTLKQDIVDWVKAGHTRQELDRLLEPPDCFPLQFMDAALETDMSPPRWIVQGLLPAGSLNFLVAKPKVGKTTLARSLALAVAQGRDWLGYATHPGEVWYLAFEGRLADHLSHFIQLGATKADPIAVQEQRPFPGHLDAMFTKMRERKPALVIIDHMQLALQLPKMNDVGLVTMALQPFIEFTRETGCAVLFLAHARKGQSGFGADDEDAIDALAGAGAFGGACDTYILLKKSRGHTSGAYRTIETVQRIGDPLDPTVLEFDRESGLLRFAGNASTYKENRVGDELVQALTTHGEPMGDAEWFAQVPGHKSVKLRARVALLRSERVRRVAGTGRRGNPYLYWLTPTHSGDITGDTSGDISVPFGSDSGSTAKSDLFET